MKNWNVPVVEELDVTMTANGAIYIDFESRITGIWSDKKEEPNQPETTPSES